jgi:UrcA family protein
MKNFSLNNILSAAAFSLVAGFAINASAAGQLEETYVQVAPSGVRTVVLQYSQSDLATEQGRNDLEQRIASAAKKVCHPIDRNRAGSLSLMSESRKCAREAQLAAISQIGSGQVAVIGH